MDSSIDPMNILELRIKVEPPDDDAGPSTSPALNYNEISDEGEDYGELSKICRLCGVVPSKPTTVLKIFDNECARKEISEKINKYLPIQVSMEDPLPKTICADCIGLIENWDGLVKRTKIIEEKLKEKCRNDQRLPINKPTDTQENTNTNDEIVPIIENYTYIRDDLHGVSSDPHSLSAIIKSMLTDDYFNVFDIDMEGPNIVYVCQICPGHPTSTTTDNLSYHLFHSHPTYITNKQSVEKFIKENITFEEILDDHLIDEDPEPRATVQLPNYYCPFCDSAFSSPTRLVCHLNKHIEVNLDDGVTCCDNHYPNKKSFVAHLQIAHMDKNVHGKEICKSCDFATNYIIDLQLHISKAHPESKNDHEKKKKDPSPKNQKFIPAVCPECDKVFSNKYNMLVHMKNHSKSSVKFACDKCNRTYTSRGNLSHHKKIAHEGLLPFPCPLCGEAFPSRMARDVHARIHTGSKPFSCQFCDKSFRAKNSLERHIDMHLDIRNTLTDAQSAVSPEPDFASDESRNTRKEYIEKPQTVLMKDGKKYGVCDVCQKGVMLASWRRHVRSHRSVKSFSCEACGLGFSDGGNLARHARALHGDDRPHACHICLKKFSRNSHLQDHIKSHFDSREFVCDLCGKASKSSSALRMHKRTHDDYKFHCMYCEAKFKRRAHLSAHVSVHTGEKAHECACGKTFRLRSQLTSHARVHERRDSFETPQFKAFVPLILLNWTYVDNRQSIWRWCYVCDKRFQREVFTTHVYTMHAEFQLHCEVCNTFVEKQEYVAHMSQHSYERSIEKEKHAKTTTKKILDVNLAWFVRHEFCDCKNIMCTFNKEMMYKICPTYIDYDCITETMAHILNTSLGKVRCAYEEHYIEHVTRRKKLVSLPTELNTIGTPRQTKIAGKISIRCLLNNLNNLVAIKRQSELHHYRVDCFKRRYGPDQKQLPGRPVRVYDANIQIKLELQDEVNNNANTTESNDDTNTPAVRRIERNRKCRFCGKVYTSSVDYFVHVRHAHKESQGLVAPSQPLPVFKCRDCNKRLRCRQSLLMHCRRHTGVKNYHCSSCDKSFRWRIHLEKHEKVHGPRVKYACPTCQKVFTVKCDLRKHQRKHVVKNFECTICKEKFTGDRYLKVHMTRKHKNGNESGGKIVKKVKGIKSTTDVGTRKPIVQARRVSTRNK